MRYVWVVDPAVRAGYLYTNTGHHGDRQDVLTTEDPELVVPLPEIFAALEG